MHCFEETSTGQYCDLYYRSVVIFGLVDLSFRIYTALFIDVFLVPACASCNCPQDLNYNEEFGYSDTHAGKTIILFAGASGSMPAGIRHSSNYVCANYLFLMFAVK